MNVHASSLVREKIIRDDVTRVLLTFRESHDELRHVFLSTIDGFVVASTEDHLSAQPVAALSASLKGIIATLCQQIALKTSKQCLIESDNGFVVCTAIEQYDLILTIVERSNQHPAGQLIWSAKQLKNAIEKIFGQLYK